MTGSAASRFAARFSTPLIEVAVLKSVHEPVEHIAMEVPIWLRADDIRAIERRYGIRLAPDDGPEFGKRHMTGHIDILQVRDGALHILDYKPDVAPTGPSSNSRFTPPPSPSSIPGLKLFDIECAWFNEHCWRPSASISVCWPLRHSILPRPLRADEMAYRGPRLSCVFRRARWSDR
jgi:hypothetical protein